MSGAMIREFERALEFHRRGQFIDALSAYDGVLAKQPDHAEALRNSANLLRRLGRLEEAISRYDMALKHTDDAITLYNRGGVFEALERWQEAADDYYRAISNKPEFPEALNNLGNVLNAMRLPEKALPIMDEAIAVRPNYAQAFVNRGNVLRDLLRFDSAMADYNTAIQLEPHLAQAFNNRGVLLRDQLRLQEAIADFQTAMRLTRGSYHDAAWNLGVTQLLTGRWQEGWTGYDQRLLRDAYRKRRMEENAPSWQGESLVGKRLLLWTEQGYGDMIQFIRFAALLPFAEITVLAPARMHRLLSTASASARFLEVVPEGEFFDFQLPLMSLPRLMAVTPETAPNCVPYLNADDRKVSLWRDRLPLGFKVGLAWQGNPSGKVDKGRSMALALLRPVLENTSVTFVSLQKGNGLEQLVNERIYVPLPDFDEGSDAFADTAAIISHLDLIITTDTAVAHLAGALAKPVWLMAKYVPDWRWLLERTDTPWYPSMRLYRQPSPGNWAGVVSEISSDLKNLSGPKLAT